jgi:hypothetical protein
MAMAKMAKKTERKNNKIEGSILCSKNLVV